MPEKLKVGVVGAGIAGLSAAIALARAGHFVEVYEKSKFQNEVGAAIVVGPNGTKILSRWGFDFDKAGALDYNQMRRIKADTAEVDSEEYFTNIKEQYGGRWLMFHRADLHTGLQALMEAQHPTPKLHLGEAVQDVDVGEGIIKLSNGTEVKKQLVIIADGSHSKLIGKVVGRPCPVNKAPMSMYRFLQPMKNVLAHPQAGKFYKDQPSGFTVFYKTAVGRPGLLLNTYPCRGGQLLYVALLHPTKPNEKSAIQAHEAQGEAWNAPADVQDVLSSAEGFHPAIRTICEDASDVKVYTNMWRDPIETFTSARAVLIGDCGHLMLQTHGQGACMALEDAMALEVLFDGIDNPAEVQPQLTKFDNLRRPRVGAVQTMSNKMMSPPDQVTTEVRKYYDGPIPGPTAKTFSKEYNDFFFLYDVAEEARRLVDNRS